MARIWLPTTLLLAGIELVASGCGAGSPRVLQSISVTPASADANSFPNGEVQFTVMGAYSHSRLRELMLGGTSRSIFQEMTVPVLMSH